MSDEYESRSGFAPGMTEAYDALRNGEENWVLLGCIYKGQPSACIAKMVPRDDGELTDFYPVFIWITDEIAVDMADPDGDALQFLPRSLN